MNAEAVVEEEHVCHESTNPRHAGRCACGRRVDVPESLVRSLEFERGTTHQAAKGVCDPSRLIEHAETRSQTLSGEYVRSPMLIAPERNRRLETREELADARNHLLWDSQQHIEDEDRTHENLLALRHICLAYSILEERE